MTGSWLAREGLKSHWWCHPGLCVAFWGFSPESCRQWQSAVNTTCEFTWICAFCALFTRVVEVLHYIECFRYSASFPRRRLQMFFSQHLRTSYKVMQQPRVICCWPPLLPPHTHQNQKQHPPPCHDKHSSPALLIMWRQMRVPRERGTWGNHA